MTDESSTAETKKKISWNIARQVLERTLPFMVMMCLAGKADAKTEKDTPQDSVKTTNVDPHFNTKAQLTNNTIAAVDTKGDAFVHSYVIASGGVNYKTSAGTEFGMNAEYTGLYTLQANQEGEMQPEHNLVTLGVDVSALLDDGWKFSLSARQEPINLMDFTSVDMPAIVPETKGLGYIYIVRATSVKFEKNGNGIEIGGMANGQGDKVVFWVNPQDADKFIKLSHADEKFSASLGLRVGDENALMGHVAANFDKFGISAGGNVSFSGNKCNVWVASSHELSESLKALSAFTMSHTEENTNMSVTLGVKKELEKRTNIEGYIKGEYNRNNTTATNVIPATPEVTVSGGMTIQFVNSARSK